MRAICYLDDLIKGLEEYKKNKVKLVSVEIDETEGRKIKIAPDRGDIPTMRIPQVIFL